MSRRIISTTAAPAAIGTYSQAVAVGGTVYVSGQIPLDPATGQMVEGDFAERTRQVFRNLAAIAEAAGGDLSKVVRYTIFLTDLGQFPTVNAVMQELLPTPYPARATVQVSALPRGTDVEIDAVLVLD
jgi:reactive intermediate/imine deaminase